MLKRRTFLALGASALTFRFRTIAAEPATFAPENVRADLEAIWAALLDVGAQPFRTSDRSTVERIYRAAVSSIVSPMTIEAAWLVIAPVLGALNDGHVGLGFPGDLNKAPFTFPLRFRLSGADDELTVTSDHTGTIPVGSHVIAIEGITAENYRKVTLGAFGGQTTALNRERLTMAGAWSAVALFGERVSYQVRWADPEGADHLGSIPAAPAPQKHAADPYTFTMLRRGEVGYIDYRSCEDLDRFKTFLNAAFSRMKDASTKALIIDVRRNGGGDSDLNDLLWTYAQPKPFKQFGGVIKKASARLKREYGRKKYVEIYGEDAWAAPNGTILTSGTDPNTDLITPVHLRSASAAPYIC